MPWSLEPDYTGSTVTAKKSNMASADMIMTPAETSVPRSGKGHTPPIPSSKLSSIQ